MDGRGEWSVRRSVSCTLVVCLVMLFRSGEFQFVSDTRCEEQRNNKSKSRVEGRSRRGEYFSLTQARQGALPLLLLLLQLTTEVQRTMSEYTCTHYPGEAIAAIPGAAVELPRDGSAEPPGAQCTAPSESPRTRRCPIDHLSPAEPDKASPSVLFPGTQEQR
jgi:hypothetical protein